MTYQQEQSFRHLREIELSLKRRFKPTRTIVSRSRSKHPTVGQVYRGSTVKPQVPLEQVFNHPGWTKEKATA